ncbi:MAG: hypothetical protein EON86_13200 [Brevundimonas sp.]|nr:MAG: hypothetical protein EON86_13200 [Brevundimonas sp.]
MKTFSVTEALTEPFRQAGRRPLAPLLWGLVLLLPSVATLMMMLPMLAQMQASGAFQSAAAAGADPSWSDADLAAMMQMQMWSWLANLLQLVAVVLVSTAVMRAVFAGEKRDKAAFLRFSLQEIYVAVMGIVVGVGFIIVALIAVLAAVAIGFAFRAAGDVAAVLYGIVAGIALLIAGLMLWGRLALLAPASVYYNTFAFEEGWRLGRRQNWALLGMQLLLVIVFLVLGIALFAAFMLVVLITAGGLHLSDPVAVSNWAEGVATNPMGLIVAGLVLLVPIAWIQGFSQLMVTAPFAYAVKTLAAQDLDSPSNSADTSDPAL